MLRNTDGTDNEQPYADIVCLHLTGDIQREVVLDSFAKVRPSATRDEYYDGSDTDSDDDVEIEENVDWSVPLEAVVVAPKKARARQKIRQPVTGDPKVAATYPGKCRAREGRTANGERNMRAE